MAARMALLRLLPAILASTLFAMNVQASAIYYTIGLRGQPVGVAPSSFIAFEVLPQDSNGDTWYETVLRINLRDPGLSNPYNFAQFRVTYDDRPFGLTVNIGDSQTNNGGSGDSGTQSNDAEMQIGGLVSNPSEFSTLRAFGKDSNPATLATIPGLAASLNDVILTVGDESLSWDNGLGTTGSITSPLLYALNGQADSEGPQNYNIYAAFNRVIANNSRIGAGVGQVTVCLSTDASCFPSSVPVPGSFALVLLGLGLLAGTRKRMPADADGETKGERHS